LEKNAYYRPRYNNGNEEKPLFINDVALDTMPRIFKIMDALFTAIEQLGGNVNSDLSIKIRTDTVRFTFTEAQDKITHELTKEEARKLVEYNDRIKSEKWASKPQIRKYDYIYNGKLSIMVVDKKTIRDNQSHKIEDRRKGNIQKKKKIKIETWSLEEIIIEGSIINSVLLRE